jgi:predicted small lipoprotein YifL
VPKRKALNVIRSTCRGLTINVLRLTVLIFAAGALIATVTACGKKTAPIPPEDVPPAKKERSSSKLGVQYTFS